jgi:carbonic anhydrase
MHYVLANTKYGGDVATASQHEDGLVVLATIFHASRKNETHMQPLLNGLERVIDEGSNTTLAGEKLLLDHILPVDRDLFFKYQGSLTTPPCSQAVDWIVFRDISSINKRQLSYFRALTKRDPSNRVVKIGHNVRELQLQEDRKVYGSVGKRVGTKQGFLDKVRNILGFPKEEPAVKLM